MAIRLQIFVLLFLAACCVGQTVEPKATLVDEQSVDAKQLFVEAAAAYGEKNFAKAAELYVRLIDGGTTWTTVPYNAACSFARLGRMDDAFKYLELAVQRGWSDVEQLKSDPDLESIRSDKRWDAVVGQCAAKRDETAVTLGGPELRAELMRRMNIDQQARLAEPPDASQITKIDAGNTAWMKRVIEKRGWPGYALVGDEGAQAAWLLVQHADQDPAFQRRCLDLLTQAYKKGDAAPDHVAYLTDRVLVAEGKAQVYGTQFHNVDGKLQPRPIENEAEVDQRRAAMGLGLLAEYAAQMRALYGP